MHACCAVCCAMCKQQMKTGRCITLPAWLSGKSRCVQPFQDQVWFAVCEELPLSYNLGAKLLLLMLMRRFSLGLMQLGSNCSKAWKDSAPLLHSSMSNRRSLHFKPTTVHCMLTSHWCAGAHYYQAMHSQLTSACSVVDSSLQCSSVQDLSFEGTLTGV